MPNIYECFRNWNIEGADESFLAKAQVVVTHEFGNQHNISITTRRIVLRGIALAKAFHLPMICQYPGTVVAEQNSIKPIYTVIKHRKIPDAYLDTEEVNRQVAEVCKHFQFKTAILVAQPDHLWRAALNLERHGIGVLPAETRDIPYDANLDRFWLKSPARFVPREVVARLMYLKKGWI